MLCSFFFIFYGFICILILCRVLKKWQYLFMEYITKNSYIFSYLHMGTYYIVCVLCYIQHTWTANNIVSFLAFLRHKWRCMRPNQTSYSILRGKKIYIQIQQLTRNFLPNMLVRKIRKSKGNIRSIQNVFTTRQIIS